MIAILTSDPLLQRMLQLEVERGGFSLSTPEKATLLLCDATTIPRTPRRAAVICFEREGSASGAHHTLPLPYDTAALQALLQRYESPKALVPLSGGVLLCGRFISLSPTEERLLHLLLEGGGKAVPEEVLRTALSSEGDGSNLLQALIYRLRRKLSPDGVSRVRALRGRGYMLVAEGC